MKRLKTIYAPTFLLLVIIIISGCRKDDEISNSSFIRDCKLSRYKVDGLYSIENKFDSQNRIEKAVYLEYGQEVISLQVKYENGKKTLLEAYEKNTLIAYLAYDYNELEQLLRVRVFSTVDDTIVPTGKYELTYYGNNVNTVSFWNEEDELEYRERFYYDVKDNLIQRELLDGYSYFYYNAKTIKFGYDDAPNAEKYFLDELNDERMFFGQNNRNNITKAVYFDVNNRQLNVVNYTYLYNEDHYPIMRTLNQSSSVSYQYYCN